MYAFVSYVIGPPGVQRVPLKPYVRFAWERSEPSRGVDGLAALVLDDPEISPKSPGVEHKLFDSIMFES